MKGVIFEIKGNWAHFRKPETNNNPLTHDFVTKTALIGMIGAVLGIERSDMKKLFPQLSEDLLYGVQIVNNVKKESWGFTLRKVVNVLDKAPKQMEFLRNLHNQIALALKSDRSKEYFDNFVGAIKQSEAMFTPVLGLHNCPAEITLLSEGEFLQQEGEYITKGFVKEKQLDVKKLLSSRFRLGVEKIPTFQNDDFWNLPDRYERVIYPSESAEIYGIGEFFEFSDGTKWTLV